jgi:capsid protein
MPEISDAEVHVAYPVPPDFAAKAHVNVDKNDGMYAAFVADPEAFWREHGKRLQWTKPYTKVKDVNWDISKTNNPADLHVKWFEDGTLNVSSTASTATCPTRPMTSPSSSKAMIPLSRPGSSPAKSSGAPPT